MTLIVLLCHKITVQFSKIILRKLFGPFLCEYTIDSQEHLLVCPGLKKHLSADQVGMQENIRFEHLFGDPSEQSKAVKVFHTIL